MGEATEKLNCHSKNVPALPTQLAEGIYYFFMGMASKATRSASPSQQFLASI
jgi:hypothetical protein